MYNQKRIKTTAVLVLLAMLLNMILPVSALAAGEDGSAGDDIFSCWTMSGETKIDGVLTDGKYVLTVPHDMAAADVVVYFTGTVTAASAGELAAEESKVTGAFANASEVTLTGTETSYTVALVQQDAPVVEDPFTCWTMYGETKIDGVLTDGKYVLTVPHDMAAADVVVYFTGTVTETSAGELAAEESKVTGAFADGTEVTLTGSETTYTVVLVQEEAEEEAPVSGSCGENLTWTFDEGTGTLTITGSGAMYDYEFSYDETENTVPWGYWAAEQAVTSVILDDKITEIGEYAFANTRFETIDLPDALQAIGAHAFELSYITEISIPDTVTSMGEGVFWGCWNLEHVVLSSGLTEIADDMFYECFYLTSISIPEGVTSIGNEAFYGCNELSSITLPKSLERIGNEAFRCPEGGSNITTFTVPANVTYIGNRALTGAFTCVVFEGDAPSFASDVFELETLVVYYPKDNSTWTADVMQNYGGTITWIEADQNSFTCYTHDEKENQVDAYWSEEDGIWYLFVPSTVVIPEMTLSYTGTIAEVSKGTLDMYESKVTGAFSESGDVITLKDADGEEYKVRVMQSGLPSVHIVLKDATLSDVHKDKDVKYKKNSVYIMDPAGTYDLTVEDSVEMKGRGNTSWQWYEKKGYQIKFDSKTSVLGMGKAKKWVLLANASDDSMMRTSLTYRMAENLDMGFVPAMEYVDLWINGEYRGTYTIGDKVEPGSSRLDLQHDQGALFEHDEAFYHEEDHWIFSEQLQRHFALKEIVEEEDEFYEAAKADFTESVDELVEYIRSTLPSEVTLEDLNKMIDVDSFIKYYLVTEYVLNREAIVTSFYWYKDGPDDVIHLGPIWDYDTCMGNDGTDYTETSAENHPLFTYLFAIPAFYERALELKDQYWNYLTAMDEDADVVRAMIEDSAEMNYLRWDSLGKPSNKDGSDFADTFAEAVSNVQKWLRGRAQAFTMKSVKMINTTVSDRCDQMEVCYEDGDAGHTNVKFAVWHDTKKQSDLRWYDAVRDADGVLRANVDLVKHKGAGLYYIDAYAFNTNGNKTKIATGQAYVKLVCEPDYTVNAEVSDDCQIMTITYTDIKPHDEIRFAVWSGVDGQDDLAWYTSRKDDGKWTYTVDLRNHHSAGTYHIHVYSIADGAYINQAEHTVNVEKAVLPPVTATVSADCGTMQIAFAAEEQHDEIRFAVWSAVDGQDDLAWYVSQKDENDTWTYTADLRNHNSAGTYHVHVYAIADGAYDKQAEYTVHVEKAAEPPMTAVLSENGDAIAITYTAETQHEHVHFAVWSAEGDQDDLHWYAAEETTGSQWTYTVDLRMHNSVGIYHIHAYSIDSNGYTKLIEYKINVEKAAESPVSAVVSKNCEAMEIVFNNGQQHDFIQFAVWSDEGGQDDLRWYNAAKDADGKWVYTVDVRTHNSAGIYHIHVYSISANGYEKQAECRVNVAKEVSLPITVTVAQDKETMTIVFEDSTQYDFVQFAVWSDADGQDDLHWYMAEKNTAGQWKYVVNLKEHHSEGTYNIHVYSITNATLTKQLETLAAV